MNSGQLNPVQLLRNMATLAGSRNLSVFVLVMSISYMLILAVFGLLVELRWLVILSGLLPFQILYALFFLNLILVGITWVPAVIRRCQKAEIPRTVEQLGHFESATEIHGSGFRIQEFTDYLKRRGYQIWAGEGAHGTRASRPAMLLYASSGRFAPLGNLLFHAAFLLILVGAVVNVYYRFEGGATIVEGRPFTGAKAEYRTITGAAAAKLPNVDFDVEAIAADFWNGRLFFTRLEAQLLHRGGRDIARLSSAASVGNAAVTIAGYGYVPKYQLKNTAGRLLDEGHVILDIFTPGSEDSFQVQGYPHKIFVSFYPDHAQVNGKIVNKSMDPVNPVYSVRVFRGRIPVYTGFIKPGEQAQYDGLSLSFPSYRKSGEFQIVRNPGHPFIWIAFVMMVAGLAWRLLLYRKELLLWQDDAGRTWLAGRFDYYPKLHAEWLSHLAVKFAGIST